VKSGPAPQRFRSSSSNSETPWELVLSGDLTEKGGDLMEALTEVPFGSTGTIFFDSGGGSAYAGLALASVIRLRGLNATGVVAGECSSAALIPFAACRQRIVTPQSTLLFHPVRWQSDEEMQLEEAAEWARHFQVLERSMDDLLAKLFEVPVEQITGWTRPGRFLSGAEFAAAGLAQLIDLFSGDLRQQLAEL
jgi:ATP-dependent Clp protease protease subunit